MGPTIPENMKTW